MHIYLVVSPPHGGGSDYALKSMGKDDAIIDIEGLTYAMRSKKLAEQVMKNAIGIAMRNDQSTWIVSNDPAAELTIPHVQVFYVDPGQEACLAVATTDEEIEDVKNWYTRRAEVPVTRVRQGIQWLYKEGLRHG